MINSIESLHPQRSLILDMQVDPGITRELQKDVVADKDAVLRTDRELLEQSGKHTGVDQLLNRIIDKTDYDAPAYYRGAYYASGLLRRHGVDLPEISERVISGYVRDLEEESKSREGDIHEAYTDRLRQLEERNPELADTIEGLAEETNPMDSYFSLEEEEEYKLYDTSMVAGALDLFFAGDRALKS